MRCIFYLLLGPAKFRKQPKDKDNHGEDKNDDDSSTDSNVIDYNPEDFAPDFPKEMIPNLRKGLKHFWTRWWRCEGRRI